jgi:transcription factor IIIB 90 kDa subunit
VFNGMEDQKISGKSLSDAYQNVLQRLARLQELGQVGKGANRRKIWREALELEPWMDSVVDDWGKHISLEELEDIDIGYDAPPPSFTANLELEKQRRERIEAAKRRIDAIRKAPAAISNHSQPVPRAEDVCSPQKLPRNERGRKKMDGRDKIMPRDTVVANPIGPDGSKKRRRRVSLDGIDWEDCIIELLLLHGASESEIEEGQYRRLLELHVFSAVHGGG